MMTGQEISSQKISTVIIRGAYFTHERWQEMKLTNQDHVWSYLPVNIGKVLLHPRDVTHFLEEELHRVRKNQLLYPACILTALRITHTHVQADCPVLPHHLFPFFFSPKRRQRRVSTRLSISCLFFTLGCASSQTHLYSAHLLEHRFKKCPKICRTLWRHGWCNNVYILYYNSRFRTVYSNKLGMRSLYIIYTLNLICIFYFTIHCTVSNYTLTISKYSDWSMSEC